MFVFAAGIHGHNHQSSYCFEYPKKVPTYTPVNQVTQKNTCQIFPPKRIPETKISSPQKSFCRPKYPLGNYKRGLLGTVKAWV